MNKSADETLKELIAGIAVYGVAAQIVCFFVADNLRYVSFGLWIGIAVAIGFGIHLKRSIEDALDYGESGAVKHMRKSYAFRYAVTAVIFGAAVYFEVGHPIALLAGVMGLKIGAYVQPYTHRVLKKLQKSK